MWVLMGEGECESLKGWYLKKKKKEEMPCENSHKWTSYGYEYS